MSYANRRRGMDKHMKALGFCVAIWAELEHRINQAIWELANVEARAGVCLTAQMIGPGPRIRALVALVTHRGGSGALRNELNQLASDLTSLGGKRNRLAHDPWVVMDDRSVARLNVTAERKIDYSWHHVELQELMDFFEEVELIYARFMDLWERILSELPSWPRTQYEQSPGIRHHRLVSNSDNQTPEPQAQSDHE